MENEDLYRGRFEYLADRQLKSVRIFISSTFSDTTEERNGLIEYVYPKLREYCLNQYQIQFQYSDMRWGIQSTAVRTHSTVDMCLDELDTCCQLSLATNCVILLSHRYGSRFIPASISFDLFHYLEQNLSSNSDDREFLFQMYQLDENYLDKKYILRNIDDEQQWILQEKKLEEILRYAAKKCYEQGLINEDQWKEFFISVTAKEIHRALINNRSSSRRIVCFFRNIIDINQLDGKYREIDNEIECQNFLDQLKQDLHQSIDPLDIHTYQVQWTNEQQRKEYLSRFFQDFYHGIKSQIDYHMQQSINQRKSLLYNQIFEHAIQCKQLTRRYFPRNDILEQIKEYILSTNNVPCVLVGESGTGKSSIMAKLVSEIPKWLNSVSVIIRFLGATPSSSDIRRPMISIIEQICEIYHLNKPSMFTVVKDDLENILMNIPKNEQLILLIDSIDQLNLNDLKNLSQCLPTHFPSSNIKCIYSTISNVEIEQQKIDIYQQLKTIYSKNFIEIKIPTLNENLAKEVIFSWLERDRRCLTLIQHQWLQSKFTVSHWLTPLFLSLLYDQTLTWHSYDQIPDPKFLSIKRTTDAIGYLYNQLGEKHGSILFRRSMKYLQLSGGLSELEMEDLLSSDDDILQSVFQHYLPPRNLFRLPSTLWIRIRNDMQKYLIEKDIDDTPCIYFYHRSFQYYKTLNVQQMMIDNKEDIQMENIRLNYFANQYQSTFNMNYSPKLMKKYHLDNSILSINRCLTPQKSLKKKNHINFRRLHQLYININRYDFVHLSTIFNYNYLITYLTCGEYQISDLLYQFSIGAHDPNGELRYILKEFERCSSILNEYPMNLSFELIYRLLPYENYLPDHIISFLEQCIKHCPLQLKTNYQRIQSLAKYSLTNIIDFTLDSQRLFILTNDNQLYIFYYHYYGILSLKPLKIKYSNKKFLSFLCEYPYICCFSIDKTMFIINWETKQISMEIFCHQLITFININYILICSLNMLELWNCEDIQMKCQYDFQDQQIDQCQFNKSIIIVCFKQSKIISYLSIDEKFQFQLIKNFNNNFDNYPYYILINNLMTFHYSYEYSQCLLIFFNENNNNSKEIIDFISPPKYVTLLRQSRSIAWLTSTSLMIFQPIINKKFFQPFSIKLSIEYDLIHDHYSSLEFENQTNFFACLNQIKQIIDIYEWKYEDKYIYRQLARVQLDMFIDRFVFTAHWFDGITIYVFHGSNLCKYNATMITYLLSLKSQFSSLKIEDISNTSSSNEYFTIIDRNHLLKIYTINDDDTFHLNFSFDSIRMVYFTKRSSHILIINQNNSLLIYSLITSKLLWSNDQFNDENIRIHPIDSAFICISSNQIYLLDTEIFQLKFLTQFSNDIQLSTVTSNNRLYILFTDPENLLELNIINSNVRRYSLTDFHLKKIYRLDSVYDRLIFHTDDEQIHLWQSEKQRIISLENASKFISKDHRLVLVSNDDSCLILYDLKEKLRGIISLDEDIGHCEALQLSEQNQQFEQYLFTISHDGFLRMYSVSNGKQLCKLFIHSNLTASIVIIQQRVLLQVDEQLCLIKIIDRKQHSKRIFNNQCPLFQESMWMICHHNRCTWSDGGHM